MKGRPGLSHVNARAYFAMLEKQRSFLPAAVGWRTSWPMRSYLYLCGNKPHGCRRKKHLPRRKSKMFGFIMRISETTAAVSKREEGEVGPCLSAGVCTNWHAYGEDLFTAVQKEIDAIYQANKLCPYRLDYKTTYMMFHNQKAKHFK